MSSQRIVRERHGDHLRLVCFQTEQTDVWDQEWQDYTPEAILFVKEYYRRYSVIYKTLLRYLPKDGEVLEAGSGLGYWVSLLAEAGFDVRGVDNSEEAVARSRETFPSLQFDLGDVRELPYPDASLSGYTSFGVAEHFRPGPQPVLREAARLLRQGGILILTVPWISPLRRIQPLDEGPVPEDSLFYQYFFETTELGELVTNSGFRPLAYAHYGAMKTLRDFLRSLGREARETTSVSTDEPASDTDRRERDDKTCRRKTPAISTPRKLFWHVQNAVFENPVVRRLAGHMLLVVAVRT